MSARDALFGFVAAGAEEEDLPTFAAALDAYAAEVAATARTAALREAADVAESLREFEHATGARKSAQVSENVGIIRVADKLRRMATEGGEA